MRPAYLNSRTERFIGPGPRTIDQRLLRRRRSGFFSSAVRLSFSERIKLARKDLLKRSLALLAATVATGEGCLGTGRIKQADKTQTPFHILACPFVASSIPGAGLERLRPSSWLSPMRSASLHDHRQSTGDTADLGDRSDGGPPMRRLASLQIHPQSPRPRKTSPTNARSQHKSSCSPWLPTLTNHVPGTGQLSREINATPFFK